MRDVFIQKIGNKQVVVKYPNRYIHGRPNQSNQKACFECFSKGNHSAILLIPVVPDPKKDQ
jgi:hypothetical protein